MAGFLTSDALNQMVLSVFGPEQDVVTLKFHTGDPGADGNSNVFYSSANFGKCTADQWSVGNGIMTLTPVNENSPYYGFQEILSSGNIAYISLWSQNFGFIGSYMLDGVVSIPSGGAVLQLYVDTDGTFVGFGETGGTPPL